MDDAMSVARLMTSDVGVCGPGDSLQDAARILFERDCGMLPVVDGGRLLGVLTDRDICRAAWGAEKPLKQLRVEGAMSTGISTCSPGDSLGEAERRMRAAQVRRLPVVEENDALLGILSLADLARHVEAGDAGSEVSDQGVAETLARICTPPGGGGAGRGSPPSDPGGAL